MRPAIMKHAIDRGIERRKWVSESMSRGCIQAAFQRGVEVGRFRNKHNDRSTRVVIDRQDRIALMCNADSDAVMTVYTPDMLRIDFEQLGDEIQSIHRKRIRKVERERHTISQYIGSERPFAEIEMEQLDTQIDRMQAKLWALMARRNAIQATIDDYERDIEQCDERQRRLVRSLAAVKLS